MECFFGKVEDVSTSERFANWVMNRILRNGSQQLYENYLDSKLAEYTMNNILGQMNIVISQLFIQNDINTHINFGERDEQCVPKNPYDNHSSYVIPTISDESQTAELNQSFIPSNEISPTNICKSYRSKKQLPFQSQTENIKPIKLPIESLTSQQKSDFQVEQFHRSRIYSNKLPSRSSIDKPNQRYSSETLKLIQPPQIIQQPEFNSKKIRIRKTSPNLQNKCQHRMKSKENKDIIDITDITEEISKQFNVLEGQQVYLQRQFRTNKSPHHQLIRYSNRKKSVTWIDQIEDHSKSNKNQLFTTLNPQPQHPLKFNSRFRHNSPRKANRINICNQNPAKIMFGQVENPILSSDKTHENSFQPKGGRIQKHSDSFQFNI